jgi:threonine dehydrogenase-like Zn-dependent dehydrogenase
VLGDGKLGLLVAQVLHAHGAEVHLYGRHRHKMRIAEKAGVDAEMVPKKFPERAWPIVVDCTGSPEGLRAAIGMCMPRGTVVMKSTVHGLVPVDTAPAIVNEVTLVGSRCGRFEPSLRLAASGKIRLGDLISEEFPLDQAARAFKRAATKGVLKVLFIA